MKFWDEMAHRLTLTDSDPIMVGNMADGLPEYATLSQMRDYLTANLKDFTHVIALTIEDGGGEQTITIPIAMQMMLFKTHCVNVTALQIKSRLGTDAWVDVVVNGTNNINLSNYFGDDMLLKVTYDNTLAYASVNLLCSAIQVGPTFNNNSSGCIVIWPYDNTVPIPIGWALCDGTNGTIDMRGRFPVGSDSSIDFSPIKKTGGLKRVVLTEIEMPKHNHHISFNRYRIGDNAMNQPLPTFGGTDPFTAYTDNAGYGQSHENLPPYISLNFIQKL